MSTFLELVQDLHREVGAAGVAPTTVVGQRGENQRLVRWVQDADVFVQTLWHNWKFLIDLTFSQNTIASTQDIVAPAGLNIWDWKSFKIDNDPIAVTEYYKTRQDTFDSSIEDVPSRIIILPNNNLRLDPIPDGVYTITADHFVKPTKMTANTDVSVIPPEYHQNVILGRAMIFYGNYENAAEIKDQGTELYIEFLGRLESLQLPNQFDARYNSEAAPIEVIAE